MAYKTVTTIFFLTFLAYLYFYPPSRVKEASYSKIPSHKKWDTLLQKNVKQNGDVDYKSFLMDISNLQEYLNYLKDNPPAKNWSKNHKLAYYINLYNAGTVKLILGNYPIKSIKDINSPWSKKIIYIGKNKFSLGYIEHNILRKMNEPRIHFAINCASYSCPKLLNKAYITDSLKEQLTTATKGFIEDVNKNNLTGKKIYLSKIFKWYKSDFTDSGGSLTDYINKYSEIKISSEAEVGYFDYNWSLNEAK